MAAAVTVTCGGSTYTQDEVDVLVEKAVAEALATSSSSTTTISETVTTRSLLATHEVEFVVKVREAASALNGSFIDSMTDTDLVFLANDICRVADQVDPFESWSIGMNGIGTDQDQQYLFADVFGYSVNTFCSHHNDALFGLNQQQFGTGE